MKIGEKIISLALEGLTNKEIADKLIRDESYVNKCIKSLVQTGETDIYNKIFMAREMRNKEIIDKDLLELIIKLSKEGKTIFEVASILNVKLDKVEEYICLLNKKSNAFYDPICYDMIINQNKKQVLMIILDNFKRVEQLDIDVFGYTSQFSFMKNFYTKYESFKKAQKVIKYYIDTGMCLSSSELAFRTGISYCFINNLFQDKLNVPYLKIILDEYMHDKVLEKRQEYIANGNGRVDIYFANTAKKYDSSCNFFSLKPLFWLNYILTFRLSLNDFASIVSVSNLEGLSYMIFWCADKQGVLYKRAIQFLFATAKDNEERKKQAKEWLELYNKAKKNEDKKEEKKLLYEIYNGKYNEVTKKHKPFEDLSLEERKIVVDYKIKYALNSRETPYYNTTIKKGISKELLEELQALEDFNKDEIVSYLDYYRREEDKKNIKRKKYNEEKKLTRKKYSLY